MLLWASSRCMNSSLSLLLGACRHFLAPSSCSMHRQSNKHENFDFFPPFVVRRGTASWGQILRFKVVFRYFSLFSVFSFFCAQCPSLFYSNEYILHTHALCIMRRLCTKATKMKWTVLFTHEIQMNRNVSACLCVPGSFVFLVGCFVVVRLTEVIVLYCHQFQ